MRLQSIGLALVFICGLINCQTLNADDSAVVFMYHRFGEDKHPSTSIRLTQFRAQMAYLRDEEFAVIPLSELMAFLTTGQQLPKNAVVITIDDAYRSIYEVAYPILMEYGFPFTVFVSTDAVDSNLPDYLSWDQIREMAGAGVSYANHGAGHIYLVERLRNESELNWRQRIGADIDKGWQRLTEELPLPNTLLSNIFAYPYGEYDLTVADQVTQRGYMAFGQHSGAIGSASDHRAMPRYPMAEAFAGMSEFRTKASSLPMPVEQVTPWDPVTIERWPQITITLSQPIERADELACFIGGQGRVDALWVEPGKRFKVGPNQALGKGRQRVNCTAPQSDGKYLWFSHQWIVQ